MSRTYNGTILNNIATATQSGLWPFRYWDSWRMYGGGGDDRLTGGSQSDQLYGDSYSNGNFSSIQGDDILYGLGGADDIYGHGGDDALYGGTGDDEIYGGSGNDYLNGGSGNDYLHGGSGNDVMDGGTGNDHYVVDSSLDWVYEFSGQGIDTVSASISYSLGSYVENLTLIGSAYQGTGTNYNNVIRGNNSFNLLVGLGGNDTMYGEGGNDTLDGGSGDDTMYGGNGNDTMYGKGGNDDLNGGNGNDHLIGVDTVSLRPGVGEIDTLTSGSYQDNDTFVLGQNGRVFYDDSTSGSSYAIITDFDLRNFASETTFDRIQLAQGYEYRLGSLGNDTHIYKVNPSSADELIGIVRDVQGLNLANTDHVVYS